MGYIFIHSKIGSALQCRLRRVQRCVSCCLFVVFWANQAVSEHGPQDVLELFHRDGRVESYTIEDLKVFHQTGFRSSSPWIEGTHDFLGIPLLSLLKQLDPKAKEIELVARDDYRVTFSLADLHETWPILALSMNGEPISPRTKGPFWVVYPFDDQPDLQREDLFARSIWQVQSLRFD